MKPLLLLKVGRTLSSLSATRGDYEVWFGAGLGVGEALHVVRVIDGEPLPDLNAYRGVVVSGSAAMVTERAAWSVATAAWLLEALARDLPVLGVCYGHQLLADALGAHVDWNPRGRQIGSVVATLTENGRTDPLFSGLPAELLVQTSHSQSVLSLPESLALLAATPRDPQHAFRVRGARAWGVQFHPEFDAEVTRAYIRERSADIRAEGQDPDALIEGVVESAHGDLILRRFAALSAIS
jgi:GMP synthase (glutamine-hydrolysing)